MYVCVKRARTALPTDHASGRQGMQGGGKQSRLLGRLLRKLRGNQPYNTLNKNYSITSSGMSESTCCDSATNEEDETEAPPVSAAIPPTLSATHIEDDQLVPNIDLRYGGQYLTPDQLPQFCDQLDNLIQVIRNIQSYATVTGEYPSSLEQRLQQEAQEVAALAAEVRNARDVVTRTRVQRRAVCAQRKHLVSHLATLRETEIRELESTVRLSDRKLFKNWESLKDTKDGADFEPLLEEIKNKQTALDCLVRLIEGRRSALAHKAPPVPPQPLPPPLSNGNTNNEDTTAASASNGHRRDNVGRRINAKRRRNEALREPGSMPLSNEPSHHTPPAQVTLFIQGTEQSSRYRLGGTGGAVALTPLELPSGGSVRDILFFTSN